MNQKNSFAFISGNKIYDLTDNLITQSKLAGYKPVKVEGVYKGEKESAAFLQNISFSNAWNLAHLYQQESFIWAGKNTKPVLYYTETGQTLVATDISISMSEPVNEDGYTHFHNTGEYVVIHFA